jgi:hypothetical protein
VSPSADTETQPSPPPPIPTKAKHDNKKPTTPNLGPVTDSEAFVPAVGPVFFSDDEDDEPLQRTQKAKHIPSEEEEDFQTFARRINRNLKRKAVVTESESEGKDDDFVADNYREDGDEDEEEYDYPRHYDPRHYVKQEGTRYRQRPQRGSLRNNPPCDNCIKRNQVCYAQESDKSRGACFECGSSKTKCIFSVSDNITMYIKFY